MITEGLAIEKIFKRKGRGEKGKSKKRLRLV